MKISITFLWRGWRIYFKNMWFKYRQIHFSFLWFYILIEKQWMSQSEHDQVSKNRRGF